MAISGLAFGLAKNFFGPNRTLSNLYLLPTKNFADFKQKMTKISHFLMSVQILKSEKMQILGFSTFILSPHLRMISYKFVIPLVGAPLPGPGPPKKKF